MKIVFAFKWAIIWAVCIFGLCIMNPSNLPSIEVNWDIGPDKFVHFSMFAVMSYTSIIGIRLNNWNHKTYWLAGIFSSLYGVGIEIIQGAFFAYRSFDYADMLANTIGAMSITLILFLKSNKAH